MADLGGLYELEKSGTLDSDVQVTHSLDVTNLSIKQRLMEL